MATASEWRIGTGNRRGRHRKFLIQGVIRVFGKEKQIVENANEKMAGHKKARMRRNHISNLCNSGFNGAMNVAHVVGTAVGGYGILTGTITYGTLMAMIQLIGQLQSPFANLTGFLP